MNGSVSMALNAKPDYSEAFTQRVSSLKDRISIALAAPLEHDDDMNFSASQKLVVWLNKSCKAVPPGDASARYRLFNYVSSKGPYFALAVLQLADSTADGQEQELEHSAHFWTMATGADLPTKITAMQEQISSVMKANGFGLLEGSILVDEVDGYRTELDGKPANVFDVLFSEV